MTLQQSLAEYISACFTGLWIQSHEHEDALTEVARMCRDESWRLIVWDIHHGLTLHPQNGTSVDTETNDPLAAIAALESLPKSVQRLCSCDAERGGIYAHSQAKGKATSRRRVARDVSAN